jgi:hypothetical protein
MANFEEINWSSIIKNVEEKMVKGGRISAFFSDVENLYPTIDVGYDPKNKMGFIKIKVETDGTPLNAEWVDEEINDYVLDNYLHPEMEKAGVDMDEWEADISVDIVPLEED